MEGSVSLRSTTWQHCLVYSYEPCFQPSNGTVNRVWWHRMFIPHDIASMPDKALSHDAKALHPASILPHQLRDRLLIQSPGFCLQWSSSIWQSPLLLQGLLFCISAADALPFLEWHWACHIAQVLPDESGAHAVDRKVSAEKGRPGEMTQLPRQATSQNSCCHILPVPPSRRARSQPGFQNLGH